MSNLMDPLLSSPLSIAFIANTNKHSSHTSISGDGASRIDSVLEPEDARVGAVPSHCFALMTHWKVMRGKKNAMMQSFTKWFIFLNEKPRSQAATASPQR